MQITNEWNHKNYQNNLSVIKEKTESITLRANYTQSKKIELSVSIGLSIAELLGFSHKDRVNIYLHKMSNNHLLIKKCEEEVYGHTLQLTGYFLRFDFVHSFHSNFKIKQTVLADWDITKDDFLLVNLSKLKWKV